jgi:DNA invertase Pin-like site-specific DNA recombinase
MNKMKCVTYCRVSTEGQALEGISLEAQAHKLSQWASLNDCEIIGSFEDAGLSGARSDRPGLAAAMEAACKAKAALVIYSLSRLSRSTADTIELADRLAKSGAELVSLSEKIDTSSASGKMIFRLLSVLNEFERDQISERTSNALQHKKAKGELVGSIPFGYSLAADGKTLEENPSQQEALVLIGKLKAKGLSLRQIAQELSQLGVPTAKGNKSWTHSAVNRIVNRKAS